MNAKNIVLVGTGAIAEAVYLPLLASRASWKDRSICVDRNSESATRSAQKWGLKDGGPEVGRWLSDAAVVIVATPPRTHYPIAMQVLASGCAVILEKPLTDTYEEGCALVQEAERRGLSLMVNNTRRLFQSYAEIARLSESGELGAVLEVDYAEGGVFAWPTASGFYFDPKAGGRGVIADRGSHVLDLFCWWVRKPVEVISCRTDVSGGVEGFGDVNLKWAGGHGRMRLSWHNKLANRVRVVFENGVVETGNYDFREIKIETAGRKETRLLEGAEHAYDDYSVTFARRSLEAVFDGGQTPVNGKNVLPSLELIDSCYKKNQRLEFPWLYKFEGNS